MLVVALIVGNLRGTVWATEEQLRNQLTFQRTIDNSLGEGVYALDRDGRVTFMNAAAERMLGWTLDEIGGKVVHDVIHFQRADGSPFPREQCTGLNEVLRSGVTYRAEDDVFTRKDGTMVPVAYSASPIVVDGDVRGVVVAFRDISAHK